MYSKTNGKNTNNTRIKSGVASKTTIKLYIKFIKYFLICLTYKLLGFLKIPRVLLRVSSHSSQRKFAPRKTSSIADKLHACAHNNYTQLLFYIFSFVPHRLLNNAVYLISEYLSSF